MPERRQLALQMDQEGSIEHHFPPRTPDFGNPAHLDLLPATRWLCLRAAAESRADGAVKVARAENIPSFPSVHLCACDGRMCLTTASSDTSACVGKRESAKFTVNMVVEHCCGNACRCTLCCLLLDDWPFRPAGSWTFLRRQIMLSAMLILRNVVYSRCLFVYLSALLFTPIAPSLVGAESSLGGVLMPTLNPLPWLQATILTRFQYTILPCVLADTGATSDCGTSFF